MTDPLNRYGFVRDLEADLIDKLLDELKSEFGEIRFLEVGVFAAGTVRGVYRRGKEIGCPVKCVGVDFESYRPNPTPDANYVFYGGDCMDVWREFPCDSRFNFLLVDSCHCVNHAQCDFLNYSPFVEVGGRILFHDTALPLELGKTEQEPWPQTDHSYAGKPPSTLGVREALRKLGLLGNRRTDFEFVCEIESPSGLMGMMCYRRILPY